MYAREPAPSDQPNRHGRQEPYKPGEPAQEEARVDWGAVLKWATGIGAAAGFGFLVGKKIGAAPYIDDHTPAKTYEEVVVRLRRKATAGCVDPDVRKLGGAIADRVREAGGSRLDELFSLFAWVRDNVRGHDDPAGRPDYFAPAGETLRSLRGDCDDYAVLIASLVQANRFETKFLVIPRHVVAMAVMTDDLLRELSDRFPQAKRLVRLHPKSGQKLLPLEVVDPRLGLGEFMRFTESGLSSGPRWLED